jgi:valyl-tRNA synthetase
MQIITGIRNIRGEMNIGPSLKLAVTLQSDDESFREVASGNRDLITNLARLESLAIEPSGDKPKASATAVIDNATLYVSLEGVIDLQQEAARLRKEMTKAAAELAKLDKKLTNADFLAKAPEDVVDKVRGQHAAFAEKQTALRSHLERIEALAADG